MKNLKQIMLMVMTVTTLGITSCSKDDDGDGVGNTGEGTITATVNGQTFTTLEITSAANTSAGGGITFLTIQGNTATQAVNLNITGYEGVGTYELSDSNVFMSANYSEPNVNDPLNLPMWNAPYQDSGVVGEINISEDADGRIKGSFSFTGKSSNDGSIKSITDGTFNLSKTVN